MLLKSLSDLCSLYEQEQEKKNILDFPFALQKHLFKNTRQRNKLNNKLYFLLKLLKRNEQVNFELNEDQLLKILYLQIILLSSTNYNDKQ